MLVSVLASGSEGNSSYIETSDAKILIDLGMTTKYIKEKLDDIGIDIKEIEYVFMTHTHRDHIGALPTFIKKYNPYIVLTEKMYNDLEELKDYEKIILLDKEVIIGNTVVSNIKLSHDSSDIRGYIIEDENSSLVYITDTGYINQKYFKKLYDKNIYILESNHDVEMLMNGKYPKFLKSRILSDKGHLSNSASGFYLSKFIGPSTKKVILAHLSKENNDKEIALETVKNTLKEYDVNFDSFDVAKQRESTEIIKL